MIINMTPHLLARLEKVGEFFDVEKVYREAMV